MSSRPTRPLPSRNGWMVSNCACAEPDRHEQRQAVAVVQKTFERAERRPAHGGRGGTNDGFASVEPAGPIQF